MLNISNTSLFPLSQCFPNVGKNFRMQLWAKDRNGKYLFCNDHMLEDLGIKNENDVVGLTDLDLCWEKFALNFRANDQEVLISRSSKFFLEQSQDINAKSLLFYSYKMPFRGTSKKTIGTTGVSLLLNNVLVNQKSSLLSNKQINCLYYLVKGMTFKEIAKKLHLSPRTVEHYLSIIKQKLNCHSRHSLIEKALTLNEIKNRLFIDDYCSIFI